MSATAPIPYWFMRRERSSGNPVLIKYREKTDSPVDADLKGCGGGKRCRPPYSRAALAPKGERIQGASASNAFRGERSARYLSRPRLDIADVAHGDNGTKAGVVRSADTAGGPGA